MTPVEPKTYIVDAKDAAELIQRLVECGAVFRASSAGDGKVRFTAQWVKGERVADAGLVSELAACSVCGCTLDDGMCLNPDCYPCGVRDERGRFRKKLARTNSTETK